MAERGAGRLSGAQQCGELELGSLSSERGSGCLSGAQGACAGLRVPARGSGPRDYICCFAISEWNKVFFRVCSQSKD
jgi:hypothetical protein